MCILCIVVVHWPNAVFCAGITANVMVSTSRSQVYLSIDPYHQRKFCRAANRLIEPQTSWANNATLFSLLMDGFETDERFSQFKDMMSRSFKADTPPAGPPSVSV